MVLPFTLIVLTFVTLTLNSASTAAAISSLVASPADAEDDLVVLREQRRLLRDDRRQDGVVVTNDWVPRPSRGLLRLGIARLDRSNRILGQDQGAAAQDVIDVQAGVRQHVDVRECSERRA